SRSASDSTDAKIAATPRAFLARDNAQITTPTNPTVSTPAIDKLTTLVVVDCAKPATIPRASHTAATINPTRSAIARNASGCNASWGATAVAALGRTEPFWARRVWRESVVTVGPYSQRRQSEQGPPTLLP